MNILKSKLKETTFSILPITLLVILLKLTIINIEMLDFYKFIIGSIFMILGLAIFLLGIDIGITPIGNIMGVSIAKSNKVSIVVISALFLGFIISIAEPDLHILANQISAVTLNLISKPLILISVSIGIAILLSIGLLRILYNIPLYKILILLYFIIFILSCFTSQEFLAISFDSSGATTGALTVPFILSLSLGISKIKKDSKASEKDSFGLVAISSTGAIISVMIAGLIIKVDKLSGELPNSISNHDGIIDSLIHHLSVISVEVLISLLPIVVIFLLLNIVKLKLNKKKLNKILFGILFTFVGLVLFLVGVNFGFMIIGNIVGYQLSKLNRIYLFVISFIFGMVTILAEPAVHVLTQQIEDVTSGYIDKNLVLATLSIGVAFAITLSIIRIVIPSIQLWHYLSIGYLLALILMFFTPKLFVGIAFDSGGVASGPMAATFILSLAHGVADGIEGANVLTDGFGIISMIAMTPLIAIQILGIVYKLKTNMKG